jgi:1,4-dihydroxy-6-naphthoate synthase
MKVAVVLAVTDDLLFRSRIGGALKGAGVEVEFTTGEKLAAALAARTPALVLVDYSHCGEAGLRALATPVPWVAYGPHMDLAGREAVLKAGAVEVLSNSQITTQLADIVRRYARVASPLTLRLGHSPDPDDAFMFYPIACDKLETPGLRFEQILRDIETLNRMALEGSIEITAASVHAYGHLADRYTILPCGGSFGDGYGPIVVARSPLQASDLDGRVIAVPGTLTSAYLALCLFAGKVESKVVPFDQIPSYVAEGNADCGLLIHEGQLTYAGAGLCKVVDLGEWWKRRTGLPLPLGVNVIRKDLGEERCRQVARLLRASIDYALEHRHEALTYAMQFGRGLERNLTDRFVGMYVNDLTLEAGSAGRAAIARFLEEGHGCGLLPRLVLPEFVEM